jgi:hypothetical protein
MVLLVRQENSKDKYLLGRDEGHWFVAAIPDNHVRDVRTAIASLRPNELEGKRAIRQGEWFFLRVPGVDFPAVEIHRNEPLSRGGGSTPHVCEQLARRGGEAVMVTRKYPEGVRLDVYSRLMATDPQARAMSWRRMVRDAEVYVRGDVRHRDHKTITLYGWHRVYMNRERFARQAAGIAFLD